MGWFISLGWISVLLKWSCLSGLVIQEVKCSHWTVQTTKHCTASELCYLFSLLLWYFNCLLMICYSLDLVLILNLQKLYKRFYFIYVFLRRYENVILLDCMCVLCLPGCSQGETVPAIPPEGRPIRSNSWVCGEWIETPTVHPQWNLPDHIPALRFVTTAL